MLELQSQDRARFEYKSKRERLARLDEDLQAQAQLWKNVDPDAGERRLAALREKRDELQEQVELLRLQVANPVGEPDVLQALTASLEAQIQGLERQLASPMVAAPFDGQIAWLADEPTRLGPGENVLEFWDTAVLIRAEIMQQQLLHVTRGCRAEISVDFSKEPPVGAIVESVELRSETPAGASYPFFGIELAPTAAAKSLRPGMRVSVRLFPSPGKLD